MSSRPSNKLDRFPNPQPSRDYAIHMDIPEFT
ncbi:MAG: NADPH-dependent 7-cyano-7-deazaguanine reductase QueF, partial [Betaproteobacteria bacterium]|nr:NADPH-dependent 7-cyano-7-deazaguanine reductase QueF [Betaproteobacteria bacterium]